MAGRDARRDSSSAAALTHERLADQLRSLLAKDAVRTISISGPWGTGKTHCVRETLLANWRDAAFASLFGVKSISSLKLSILDNMIAAQGGIRGWLAKRTKADRDVYATAIERLYSGAAIASDFALMAFRSAIQGKIIILDDIERKHADLSVDEIAGFLDELLELSSCRVILVMNSERLTDFPRWMDIREKVIDRELTLSPSPKESAAIALARHPLATPLTPLIESCGITNIRAIRKIATEVDWLDAGKWRARQNSKTLRAFLAALTLMLGAHLRALGSVGSLRSIELDGTGSIKRDDHFKNACATLLIDENSAFFDQIDVLLRSGVMPTEEIEAMLASGMTDETRYELQFDSAAARNDHIWDIDWSDEDALKECIRICEASAGLADPSLLSHSLQTLELVGGNSTHSTNALSIFKKALKQTRSIPFTANGFHPAVLEALGSMNLLVSGNAQSGADEKDTRMHNLALAGFAYASVLKLPTTVASYLQQLETMDADDMRFVVPTLLSRFEKLSGEEHPQWNAAKAFDEACRQYVLSKPGSRRARLIDAALKGGAPAR
jgi:hypothetical protein